MRHIERFDAIYRPVTGTLLGAALLVALALPGCRDTPEERRDAILHGTPEERAEALGYATEAALAGEASLPGGRDEVASLAQDHLLDARQVVRLAAVESIERLAPPDAAPALVPLLGDEAEFVRVAAARALGTLRSIDPGVIAGLVLALDRDASAHVRRTAATALGALRSTDALRPLYEHLADPIEDASVRYACARALNTITNMPFGDDIRAWRAYLAGRGGS